MWCPWVWNGCVSITSKLVVFLKLFPVHEVESIGPWPTYMLRRYSIRFNSIQKVKKKYLGNRATERTVSSKTSVTMNSWILKARKCHQVSQVSWYSSLYLFDLDQNCTSESESEWFTLNLPYNWMTKLYEEGEIRCLATVSRTGCFLAAWVHHTMWIQNSHEQR